MDWWVGGWMDERKGGWIDRWVDGLVRIVGREVG